MAASTSRQPHEIPLPLSPQTSLKQGKNAAVRKGKGKEQLGAGVPQKRRAGQADPSSNPNDHADAASVWNWTTLTDPSACKIPPIFTKDGSYFFSLVGSSVKIHSVATGQVVSTLSAPPRSGTEALSDLLTSAILNPHNAFQLITGSLDGRLMVWDFLEAVLLQTIDVAQPIHYICAHKDFKDCVFVSASWPNKKSNDNCVVLRVSLKSDEGSTGQPPEILPIGKTRFPTGLTFSPSGAWLIATAAHKVYVAMTSSFATGFTKYVSPERLTCLAFHPSEEYFATGDDKGNIRLWYCLNENLAVNARGVEKRTQTTTLHWHAHSVSSIAFTSNGAYLLSGGEESVLVIWQLHTGKKEFVPRVGAPINTISLSKAGGSEEEYLLGLADATYVFVSAATLKIARSYSRIKLDPVASHDLASTSRVTPLAVHSSTSTIVLPSSHPATLQIYSPSTSKLISELEISPSNRVSRRDEKQIEPSRVERSVISSSGEWMASIDTREGDDSFRGEIYLKIWFWDSKAGHWILNTRIDRPHGLKKVTDVSFSPASKERQQVHLVTTGGDGNVKTWRIRTNKDKAGREEEFWVARSAFGFRSENPSSVSWSPDGSLLAVSFGPYIALYDPMTNILRQTLSSPECPSTTSAHFVGRGGRYLVVAGKKDVVLWDLVAQSVRWHYKDSSIIRSISPHPHDDTFALFFQPWSSEESNSRVLIFGVGSPIPSRTHSLPFQLRSLAWYSLSLSASPYSFVGITQTWSVVLFGDQIMSLEDEGSSAREIAAESPLHKRNLFQDIFGKSAFGEVSADTSSFHDTMSTRPRTGTDLSSIFDGPAYLLPPLESLFQPLINNFLNARPQIIHSGDDIRRDADEDVEMEEATEQVTIESRQLRTVDQEEMDSFINLFKQHAVKPVRPSVILNTTNGHTNGTTKIKPTGSVNRPSTPVVATPKQKSTPAPPKGSTVSQPATGLATPISVPSPTTTIPSSTKINGKKRKKSLG